jgi:hypothetical protein
VPGGVIVKQLVESVRRSRRTIRITYFRSSGLHIIGVMQGDELISNVFGIKDSDRAELVAQRIARFKGLDVSRLDVP